LPHLLAGSYAQRLDVEKSRLLDVFLQQSVQFDRLLALSEKTNRFLNIIFIL
jgi:hypothetical protein